MRAEYVPESWYHEVTKIQNENTMLVFGNKIDCQEE